MSDHVWFRIISNGINTLPSITIKSVSHDITSMIYAFNSYRITTGRSYELLPVVIVTYSNIVSTSSSIPSVYPISVSDTVFEFHFEWYNTTTSTKHLGINTLPLDSTVDILMTWPLINNS